MNSPLVVVKTLALVWLCTLFFGLKGCQPDRRPISQSELEPAVVWKEPSQTINDSLKYVKALDTPKSEILVKSNIDHLEVKAFPSAMGHGRYATGGRGGQVLFVDNLNDSGPGSLREALETAGKRYIVVRVAGIIDLADDIHINFPNMTFEGNTAPGEGIVVRGGQISLWSSNHIIRNLSVMMGERAASNKDALQIYGGEIDYVQNIVVDHCSLSHATDENLGISAAKQITISNSIISNSKGNGGSLIGADRITSAISMVNNLQIWNDERNPRLQRYAQVEFINNMFYGFRTPAQMSYGSQFDMVGNLWENETNSKQRYTIDMLAEGGEMKKQSAFISDNLYDYGTDFGVSEDLKKHLAPSRLFSSDIIPMPAVKVRNYLLNHVGSRRYSPKGLNSYDKGLIDQIKKRVPYQYDERPYDYPVIVPQPPYEDIDRDGMDDSWEIQQFGNLGQSANTDFDQDGYTDLEEYFFVLNKE